MENGELCHRDCRNYAPVDVVKGICHRSKETVLADEQCCELAERAPRCKFCFYFKQGPEQYVGSCGAASGNPMTYPDLPAVTCESFRFEQI